jgi:hypothetical protein
VNWPFCAAKCPYCDFNSHVRSAVDTDRWRRALVAEVAATAAIVPDRRVDSVFFGGGTPSLMPPETVAAVLDAIRAGWTLATDAEISLEANPTSVEAGRFRGYRDAGVNRLSMGVQALDDPDLRALGRLHDVAEAERAFAVARAMLRLANVRKGDVLYDLGSGDGRIAIAAAKKFGIKAVGIDIDPDRIKEATENAKKAGVANLVEFRNEDLFKADFKEATVVTLYLLPDLNVKLRPRLWEDLKAGTRIVSHQFDMGTWKPEKRLESNGRTVYFWTIPPKK